jgi:DNA topoisomerase-1
MALVIVESPNKCNKIRKILGTGYEVIASVGHIMDLEKKNMGIDLNTWIPKYKINADKKDVVKRIKDTAKNHTDIYIATDDDNEGECIGFNIRDILPKKGKNIQRVIFKTITKTDVLNGIKNPTGFNDNTFDAQKVRRMTDRIVGFKVSPLMWTKGLKGTSAGRVQSAALKFIVDREKAIRSFVKEEYWTIKAQTKSDFDTDFYGINGKKYVPKSKKQADDITNDIKGDLVVADYKKKARERKPLPPYITSTLQKDAGTRFSWTSKRVMDVAQKIFSSGLISYHRTDDTRTEPSKIVDLRSRIDKKYGKKYLSGKTNIYKSKGSSQGGHEAIRPTFEPTPMNLSQDESKLLELITNRFMASQMAPAIFDQAAIKLEYTGKKKYEFRVSGSVLKFDGFLKVYGSATKDLSLPPLTVGQSIPIKKLIPAQHFTKPPARYTEPAFTEKMEKEGIGRPATYAATIETLLRRKYATREGKALKATEIGIMVCEYLEKHFNSLTSPIFTANMEAELDLISNGKSKIKSTLDNFYKDLVKEIDTAKNDKSKDLFKTSNNCPDCKNGNKLIRKVSSKGVFQGCEGWPKCGYTVSIDKDGNLKETKVETGHACPDCGNKLVEREGRFGKWISCSGYPTCTWKGSIDSNGKIITKQKQEVSKHSCPNCKSGKLVKRTRKSDSNQFFGCNAYPKCKTAMSIDDNGNPVASKFKKSTGPKPKSTGEKCPKCKKGDLLLRKGRYGDFKGCSEFRNGCKYIGK